MNLAGLLRSAPGDKTALLYGHSAVEDSLTYAELDAEVDRVASGLRRFGVRPGDRVAIGMGNIPHFVYGYLGILRAGAAAVPLNALLAPKEIDRIVADSGARVALVGPPLDGSLGSDRFEHVVTVADWADRLGAGERVEDVERSPDDLAVLAYTSGTTASPKGAMLSHGNLVANLDQQMQVPEHVVGDDVVLLALPLFHIFGLNVTLGLTLRAGAAGVLLERFEPISSLRTMSEHRVSVIFGAPPMFASWISTPGADQYDLSSARLAVSGAAPLPESALTGFRDIFGVDIYEGYGLTETAPTLTSNRMAGSPRPRSVGKPLEGVEIRLVDEHGEEVELGDTGEVVVRGPNVFSGYWQQPEETDRAFLGGWFRTGDIGVFDEDGYLYLVDRSRDLIIVSGFNVFPSEVEEALLDHPAVAEAAVVGVPDDYTGEAVKAFVVPEPGASTDEQALIGELGGRLARFKCPKTIEFVDELPHMPTGKVRRRALRDR